jgi:hypothetical protein
LVRDVPRALQELLVELRDDPGLLLFGEPRPEATPPRPGKPR